MYEYSCVYFLKDWTNGGLESRTVRGSERISDMVRDDLGLKVDIDI